ncbi:MAG: PLP-dependent transferase [Burkholderiaceae bacterium]
MPSETPVSATDLIHHAYQPPSGFVSDQPGIYKASTVYFPNVAAMRSTDWKDKSGYTYGLHGTPTTYTLEERLATLEGGQHCLLVPSGLAAIATVCISVLQSGDEVLVPDNVYGQTRAVINGEMLNWGITYQFYDPMDPADLAAKIGPATKLVWLEAAGSITLEFPDLRAMVRICRERSVLAALDNTWGAGIAFRAFDLEPGAEPPLAVDLTVHALTKYPSGGGDVLMGSIITRDAALAMRLKMTHMRLGLAVGANDAELVLRSLPSILLRYRAQDASTRALAHWALTQPQFAQVLHPSLPQSPGHAFWRAMCDPAPGSAAAMFSVVIDEKYGQDAVDAFCDALRLFKLGYSWAGPISLVVPYPLADMRTQWPAHLRRGTLVRLSIGLEEPADLQADLEQALQRALR